MKRITALAAAALLAASLGTPSALVAAGKDYSPATQPTPQMEQKSTSTGHSIEGRVKSVNLLHTKLTLDDGTKLTIPRSLKPPKEALKKGAMVSAEYRQEGSKKVVTSLQIKSMKSS